MVCDYLRGISFKTKMALAVAALFLVFVVSASYLIFSYLERTSKQLISVQQLTLVSSLTHNIDDKIMIAQKSLIRVVLKTPIEVWSDSDKAQRFLDKRIGLEAIFDNGMSLISREGRLIAESPNRADRRGRDLSSREWFKKTIATGKAYISDPYISTHNPGTPAVMMTVPVYDRHGRMTGIMAGSFDLWGENFLADISDTRIGKGGYLYITDRSRTIIVHPDKSKIMKPAAKPGANKLYDQAAQGFEGSGETITSDGIAMLATFKRLQTTSWILAANYPVSEAYAPLESVKNYFVFTALATTAALLFTVWLIMKCLMSPLEAVIRHVKQLPQKSGQERHISVKSSNELRVLASAFNSMIDRLDQQREELNDRNKIIEEKGNFLQALIDAIPDLIFYKDQDSVYLGCNQSFASLLMGIPKDQVPGQTDYDFVPPELAELFRQRDREAMESTQSCRHDEWVDLTDGRRVLVETVKVPFRGANGNVMGVIGVARDITEHKQTEEVLQKQKLLLEKEVSERQAAQEALAVKQQQLEALNRCLEERIIAAVNDLRQKDQALIFQNRLAITGEMINNITHQWRQPLNNIGLIVQCMAQEAESGCLEADSLLKETDNILRIIRFMSRTIDDFNNFFQQDKQKQTFEIGLTVSGALEIITATLKNHKIGVDLALDEDVNITGYRNEYAQVVLNILANACDVLLERKVKAPKISIRLCSEGGCSVLTIADNAGGIPDEVLPRIFDLYFSTKEPGKGTGIGLYMSKVIIEQNIGGRLTACNLDDGAQFRIEV